MYLSMLDILFSKVLFYILYWYLNRNNFKFYCCNLIIVNSYNHNIFTVVDFTKQSTLRKKCYWIKNIFFQKHVYHGFKSICYRIGNIFIGLVGYFYELIVYMLLEKNAFDSIAFFSQCSNIFKKIQVFFINNNRSFP